MLEDSIAKGEHKKWSTLRIGPSIIMSSGYRWYEETFTFCVEIQVKTDSIDPKPKLIY